jgi:hypothetical protein
MIISNLPKFLIKKKIESKTRIRHLSYPAWMVVEGTEGFVNSFQERLTLLSPINDGIFECNG